MSPNKVGHDGHRSGKLSHRRTICTTIPARLSSLDSYLHTGVITNNFLTVSKSLDITPPYMLTLSVKWLRCCNAVLSTVLFSVVQASRLTCTLTLLTSESQHISPDYRLMSALIVPSSLVE